MADRVHVTWALGVHPSNGGVALLRLYGSERIVPQPLNSQDQALLRIYTIEEHVLRERRNADSDNVS